MLADGIRGVGVDAVHDVEPDVRLASEVVLDQVAVLGETAVLVLEFFLRVGWDDDGPPLPYGR